MGAKTGEALLLLARTFESQGALLEVQSAHAEDSLTLLISSRTSGLLTLCIS